MKKFPILQVLYYTIMSIIGIIMIFYYTYAGDSSKISSTMKKAIGKADYETVVSLMTPFYNSSEVESITLSDNSEIHIFEAMSILTDDETSKSTVVPAYFGIYVNLSSDYDFNKEYQVTTGTDTGKYKNESGFNIVSEEGTSVFYRIGYSEDDSKDNLGQAEYNRLLNRFACYSVCNYLYFEITYEDYTSTLKSNVSSIEILNPKKEVYLTANLSKSLDFNSPYFTEALEFCNSYNEEVLNENRTEVLSTIYKDHQANTKYSVNTREEVTKNVPLFSGLKVFFYFVVIIILGDLLVGKRMLYKFIASHIHFKSKKEEEFNNDYEVNVVCHALVPEGYKKEIVVTYQTEDDRKMEFVLNDENAYSMTERFHNGTYKLVSIKSPDLKAIKVNDSLSIRGFKYDLSILFNPLEEKKEE